MGFPKTDRAVDVFVAGAGPAGLACAIAAASQGFQVDVADAREPPIDKACGEGLLPHALEALTSLGLDLTHNLGSSEAQPLHGIRFYGDHGATTEALFHTQGRGIRRTILHQLLLDRAIALGVRFHWKNSVQGIEPTSNGIFIRTNQQPFHAHHLVGADGHHSRIAHWAGLTQSTTHSRRIGLRQHYAAAPWSSFVEVHWSPHGQAYVTPTSSHELCVAFVSHHKFENPAEALSLYPALSERLRYATPSGRPRGSITLGRTLRRITTGNIALIGDASGSVDAITGDGLCLAFRQAIALADAIECGDLRLYEPAYRGIRRRH